MIAVDNWIYEGSPRFHKSGLKLVIIEHFTARRRAEDPEGQLT